MNSFEITFSKTRWGRAERKAKEKRDLRLLIGGLQCDRYLREFARDHMGITTGPDLHTWSRCIKSGLIDC